MGVLGLLKNLHMPTDSTTASPAATASELGAKGRNFWQKFTIGMDKAANFVQQVKSPIKVETSSKIDDATIKKIFTYAILAIIAVVALKKFKIF
jgi:hypothetical protein